jgi:general secretion pathway protein L
MPRAVRRAAAVVAFGLVAHTAVLAADVHAAGRAAAQHRAATAALLRATLPGTPSADLDRLLPAGGHGRLLPLLARAAAALAPVGGLGWSRLGWSAADDRLTLGVEAGDIGGLQRAQAALAAAGLDPASGAVTAGDNRAEGEFVVRARDT